MSDVSETQKEDAYLRYCAKTVEGGGKWIGGRTADWQKDEVSRNEEEG